ncbi:MAG: nucleotide-binding protein [Bacteroidota bacterium]|nr:nucleotide-binding protein [Bacteroidota bacterium]
MDSSLLTKLRELIQHGEKLLPEGGLEFSGYNAKMQPQYLLWRKNCLDLFGKLGEKGIAFRSRVANDENGPYFYQSSTQHILECLREAANDAATEKAAAASKPGFPAGKSQRTPVEQGQQTAKQHAPSESNRVFVVSSPNNPFLEQLTTMLKELGVTATVYQRASGASESLVAQFEKANDVRYAFWLFNADDIPNAMFELGYLVAKVGANKVCCIHTKEMQPPQSVPGVVKKEIVVKLEEISFSIMKELKAAGYAVSI